MLCERKKKEENEKWEKKAAEVRREDEVWEINRERKKRSKINEEIELNEWKHFMRLLGVEGRVRGERKEGEGSRRKLIQKKILDGKK